MNKIMIVCLAVVAVTFLFAGCAPEEARVLVINSNASDPAPKAVVEQVVAMFQEEYPEIEVQLNTFDHEAYKTNIRNFLVSEAPDVALWFAGNRMKFFVDQGLFADVSDVWQEEGLTESMSSSLAAMTIDGKQYGVPYAYYQWGVYYRTDLFEQAGASVPTDWQGFLDASAKLKAAGITPITIGTKFLWTAAGWFDYLNLRINGLDYHISLTDGDASYLDPELDAVFETWRELLVSGYFLDSHAEFSWQEAQAPMINGDAAMYLIGNFIVPFFEDADVVDNVGFFRFPTINASAGSYEDAPTDTVHIPANANNIEDGKIFLAFMARPEISNLWATGIGNLPPNKNAPSPSDRFLKAGADLLGNADGLAQFFDRDTDPEMASIGMQGFQEFMVDPSREDEIRQRLEAERARIFN